MSIVIGIVKDDFCIIAADTRITYKQPYVKKFDDDSYKLYYTGFGWIGACGYAKFSYVFQDLVNKTQFTLVDDIEVIYQKAYKEVKGISNDQSIEKSGVMYSFAYSENNYGVPDMHIEALNPILGRTGVKGKNALVIFMPPGDEIILENIRNKYETSIETSNSIDETINLIAHLIEDVSKVNNTVSNICDFGLMVKTPNNTITLARLRQLSFDIYKAYEKRCLNEYINILRVMGG